MSSDPSYPLFPTFAFIGFVLVLVPIPWHLQAWNAGTCLYMIWTAIGCLNLFINSIVWHGNALNPAPVWCDISIRLITGTSVAIPAASLCINRRLYKIATAETFCNTRSQKRRAVIEDLLIGLGIPFIEMAFLYIVSGHRFNILEDVGCYPAIINTWLAYLLVGTWPIVIGLISAVYCVLSLRAFYKRQIQFNELLASTNSLTVGRYFRLMALATTELCCTTPFATYSIYLNLTTQPLAPYRGWSDLHFNFSRVDQIPSTLWRLSQQNVISVELSRWLIVVCAFVFFMFFGFAAEARRHYCALLDTVVDKLGLASKFQSFRRQQGIVPPVIIAKHNGVLPVFVPRPSPAQTRESFTSTTANLGYSLSTSSLSSPTFHYLQEKEMSKECYGHAY